ncbi:uncharacterized protein RCH25_006001 [Pelodytes ibericus]
MLFDVSLHNWIKLLSSGCRSSYKKKKDKTPLCEACNDKVLPGERLCLACLKAAAGHAEPDPDVLSYIRQAVSEGLRQSERAKKRRRSFSPEEYADLSSDEYIPPVFEQDELSSQDEEYGASPVFIDSVKIEALIKAVRNTLELNDKREEEPASSKHFADLRSNPTFPLHETIEDLIKQEWKKAEKRISIQGHFSKLYPFKATDSNHWDLAPKVDAAIVRLAKKTTLPLDDAGTLRDPMDKRMDSNLSKAYIASGSGLRPAVALTSVSRALKQWMDDLEEDISSGVSRSRLLESLRKIKLAIDFSSEASIDLVKTISRSMVLTVASRQALWLRNWVADNSSKNSLCSLPFQGEMLFGKYLDECIKKAVEGRKAFLPQDRRPKRSFPQDRRSFRDKDFRQYRPGREFSRFQSWKSGLSSSKTTRGRGGNGKPSKQF